MLWNILISLSINVAAAEIAKFVFHDCNDGSYQITSLPTILVTRNNFSEGKHLFIRPCYNDMVTVFFNSMDASGEDVVPFIGTAGVGKSCLFLYILIQWFTREEQLKSFYYQVDSSEIFSFAEASSGFRVSKFVAAGASLNEKLPLFVDMKNVSLPQTHTGKTFIFSSFQPDRYKEIVKEKDEYIIPTWNEDEYSQFLLLDHFWTDRGLDRASHNDLVQQSIVMYGGSFRNVLMGAKAVSTGSSKCIDWKIEDALRMKGSKTAECVFRNDLCGGDLEISDVLIHRNPPVNENGVYLYSAKNVVYTVASSYIFKKLFEVRLSQFSADAKQKFNGGNCRGGEDGQLFEFLCLSVCPILEKSFDLVSLHQPPHTQEITVPAKKTMLTQNWKTAKLELELDQLYVPSHGNMESGDAFCLLNVQGVLTVVVFQMTIAEDHPVRMRGLRVISDRFPKAQQQYLVFVTPVNGKLSKPQNLWTTESKVAQRCQGLEGFKNHQFKMEITFPQ